MTLHLDTTTSRTPILCISQILTTFKLYFGRAKIVLLVTITKRSVNKLLRFKEWGEGVRLGYIYVGQNGLNIGGLKTVQFRNNESLSLFYGRGGKH